LIPVVQNAESANIGFLCSSQPLRLVMPTVFLNILSLNLAPLFIGIEKHPSKPDDPVIVLKCYYAIMFLLYNTSIIQ